MDEHFKKIEHDHDRKIMEKNYFLKIFKFITRKWNIQILYELEIHGGMNFNEIQRHLEGISSRSLSDCFKELEGLNLITRTVLDERPPKVLYELSDKGKGLIEISAFIVMYLTGI